MIKPASSLPAIAALVRAGAVERGWELFAAGGHDARTNEPAALAVKGRLLKARALGANGARRRTLMSAAADAYASANALSPAPYLAINVATMRFLAGETNAAVAEAQAVLAVLDAPAPPADTPYYLAATRAEALLLLGDPTGAEQAMALAARLDPIGWDDRAATLAQLREITSEQAGDAGWLDAFAPPSSLHYAGHMGVAAGGRSEADLAAALEELLATLKPGFAWGALAAGADLVIAEQLLAIGCEVHAVLPCPPEQFLAQSVMPAGDAWSRRFRAVLPRCASLRIASPSAASVHDPLATAHAGELAIGGAAANARRFGTMVMQLIVSDEQGGGRNTARQAELWHPGLGPQHRLEIARDLSIEALFPPETTDPARQLALHAAIGIDSLAGAMEIPSAEAERLIAPIARALTQFPSGAVRSGPGLWEVATTDLAFGLAVLESVFTECRKAGIPLPAIGAHLAIGNLIADPATGTVVSYGPAPAAARELMRHAPTGVILGGDALAAILAARGQERWQTELYLPGDPELGGSAHLLRAPVQ